MLISRVHLLDSILGVIPGVGRMDNCRIELLKEAAKFIGHCQTMVLSGSINYEKYENLTKAKIHFMNDIFKEICTIGPQDLAARLKSIFAEHFFITNLYKQCVGK